MGSGGYFISVLYLSFPSCTLGWGGEYTQPFTSMRVQPTDAQTCSSKCVSVLSRDEFLRLSLQHFHGIKDSKSREGLKYMERHTGFTWRQYTILCDQLEHPQSLVSSEDL